MQKVYSLILFLWATVFSTVAFCMDMPHLTGQVVDEAGILTAGQIESIENVLERDTKNQVALVTLKSLRGMEIEEYTNHLFNHWGLGDKKQNNGILIAIAPNEKQVRIEVGYGLEHVLTDAITSQIMRQDIIPYAQQGDYGLAAFNGAQAVIDVLTNGEQVLSTKEKIDTNKIISFLLSEDGIIILIILIPLIWNLLVGLLKLLGITSLFGCNLGYMNVKVSGRLGRSNGYRSRSRSGSFRGGGGRSGGGGSSGRW